MIAPENGKRKHSGIIFSSRHRCLLKASPIRRKGVARTASHPGNPFSSACDLATVGVVGAVVARALQIEGSYKTDIAHTGADAFLNITLTWSYICGDNGRYF
jgi:hypothetical protein